MKRDDARRLWDEGNDAFYQGKAETDCPYTEGSAEAKRWLKGWRHAKRISDEADAEAEADASADRGGPLTGTQIRELAARHYPDDLPGNDLFRLLVAVADEYVKDLERQAADDPAPFLGGTTPLDAAMNGLRENLETIRGE